MRNPAIKRILQEMKEFQKEDGSEMLAVALEDNVFEWHFAIRGPPDTEFEGGIYHGRILLPPEYPFKPPSFLMLTPNGRFETGVKICLSISSHHPEHWQPSWSVRTALTALVAFMPTPGGGAIGSLDYTKDEKLVLVRKSRAEPPTFGSAARQQIIQEVHQRMLDYKAPSKQPQEAAEQQDSKSDTADLQSAGRPAAPVAQSWEDLALTVLAGVICFLIALLLLRKVIVASGADITSSL
ncbi:hypothetical protein WJX72_005172 [[Myrmecia] bisecta]|uniref:UBC core domain-containing protein n=1 Tax=[Myrmecia] bisecta TaxID=41462 RepID=A0AAW1Q773_9CHLO